LLSDSNHSFLPISRKEVLARGWDTLDVILVTGDAYVDHPSFGAAVIGRLLEAEGLKVAVIPQPNWQDDLRDFQKLGAPRLFFGVSSGSMDSMVKHYTAARRKRSDDAYTPGGQAGFRPDRALTVYCQILKKLWPDVPIVAGGVEGSLRRLTHYDYWNDRLHPGILADCPADMLMYGMGEKSLLEVVRLLQRGVPFERLDTIPQTVISRPQENALPKNKNWQDQELHSHELCLENPRAYADNFRHIEQESNSWQAKRLLQDVRDQTLIVNPPWPPMSSAELDRSFDLPYTRLPHPRYKKRGPIPAFEMIRHSVNTHRGCFGGCSFCTISAHQGKFVVSRSQESIRKELEQIVRTPGFNGTITDLGGPSANMYQMKGIDEERCRKCLRPSCIFPRVCSNLDTDHGPLLQIYRMADQTEGVKHAFVGSGLRYDIFPKDPEYLRDVIQNRTSGRLKVAPEHTEDAVLKKMRKPSFTLFQKLKKEFDRISDEAGKTQQLIPYFISGHPGCSEDDMKSLAGKTRDLGYRLEAVQDFTPTPMTLATVIYYSGIDPWSGKKVYTARTPEEKKKQNRHFFWYK